VVYPYFHDRGFAAPRLELAEPARVRRLDHDQPADRIGLEPGGVYQLELLGVQARKLAHVAVQRAGETDDRVRIEQARGQRRREGVEVGVPMGRDHGLGPHEPILPARRRSDLRRALAGARRPQHALQLLDLLADERRRVRELFRARRRRAEPKGPVGLQGGRELVQPPVQPRPAMHRRARETRAIALPRQALRSAR
jgi:hypothetical protein